MLDQPPTRAGEPGHDPGAAALRRLFLLRDDVVYLNHGSYGACPAPVFAEYQRLQLDLEREPVQFLTRTLPDLAGQARTALAGLIGADAGGLVFVPNVTTAINMAARSVALGAGDEVVGTDHEYGAAERTWRYVCGRAGATYRAAVTPFPVDDEGEFADALLASCTPATRVLFMSHVTAPTGIVLPVAEICRRARALGMLTVVDGAHAVGQVDVDLTAAGADYYAGNCHKWLCAPKGAGFLWVAGPHRAAAEPLVVSWGWDPDDPASVPLIERLEWQGTRDPAAVLSVDAAIRFQTAHGWSEVRERCRGMALRFRAALADLTGLAPLAPEHLVAQMASVQLPGLDATSLQRRLFDEHNIEIPVVEWKGRTVVRASFQGYNSETDLERAVDALAAELVR